MTRSGKTRSGKTRSGMTQPIWRIFLFFAYGYVLSYGLRVINAVIGPSVMTDLSLSNADLGFISAAYFIAFACLQLPLGIWLDRYGARRTEAALLLLAALGCAMFAASDSFIGLWLARALIGAGVSACLMASLKAYRQWFPADKQSQLVNGMFVAGTFGALSATIPVIAVMPVIGWRGIFWIMAGLILLASILLFIFLKPIERAHNLNQTELPAQKTDGYRQIFTDPYFRRISLIGAVSTGLFLAFQSLWAGLWMTEVLAMSKSQSADVLFGFNLTLMCSFLLLSYLAPRFIYIDGAAAIGRRRIKLSHAVAYGSAAALVLQLTIILFTAPWAWGLWLLLAICHTSTSLLQSHIGLAFPASLAGRANTAYNLLLFVSAFAAQWIIGVSIDQIKNWGVSTSSAMRLTFAVCVLVQGVALWRFVINPAQVTHKD
jgi:predicted MFS family arabinose efflux permease